jgi:hypothetical protein
MNEYGGLTVICVSFVSLLLFRPETDCLFGLQFILGVTFVTLLNILLYHHTLFMYALAFFVSVW